jgi:hypothetical protein
MYAKMPKHCIDPPTPMVFDRSEAMTARTGPRSRDEGVNLISGNSRLEALDQVLAIIMGEAKVGGTVRNLVCEAIVMPMEGAYGNQERDSGSAFGRPRPEGGFQQGRPF